LKLPVHPTSYTTSPSRRSLLILCILCVCPPSSGVSSQIWNPYFKIDIHKTENVHQRRFTKAILPQLPYSERLVRLHSPTLEMRRIMADLTTCYKLLNSLIDIDSTNFFVASINTQTRRNSRKLKKNHILNISDANLFHNRVINLTKINCQSVVLATSIKRRLSSFMMDLNIFLLTRVFLRYCHLLFY